MVRTRLGDRLTRPLRSRNALKSAIRVRVRVRVSVRVRIRGRVRVSVS